MTTTYLAFPTVAEAITTLETAGYVLRAPAKLSIQQGNGWGSLFKQKNVDKVLMNLYDVQGDLHPALRPYVTAVPLTPSRIRAGDTVNDRVMCVVVAAAIRDTCRAMVVQIAGPTHAAMWSKGLSATGVEPATHYINSGPVREEIVATLSSASALSSAAGIPIEMAEGLLAQAHVSFASEADVLELLQLKPVQE